MRFHLGLGSKAKRFFLYSPAKEKAANGGNRLGEVGFKSKLVADSGLGYPDFGMSSLWIIGPFYFQSEFVLVCEMKETIF